MVNIEFEPIMSPSLKVFSIDAGSCKKNACKKFGVSARDVEVSKHGYEYKEVNEAIKVRCKGCNQTKVAYSN